MDEDGQLKSFCVYSSPEHGADTASMPTCSATIRFTAIYEIGGDVSPGDFD